MGSSQTSTTNSNSTTTADPRTQAAISPILSNVAGIANTPYNQNMNAQYAGLNGQQLSAISGLGALSRLITPLLHI